MDIDYRKVIEFFILVFSTPAKSYKQCYGAGEWGVDKMVVESGLLEVLILFLRFHAAVEYLHNIILWLQ